jgi:hypothetical protein
MVQDKFYKAAVLNSPVRVSAIQTAARNFAAAFVSLTASNVVLICKVRLRTLVHITSLETPFAPSDVQIWLADLISPC